jgi:hypothetical protein
VVAAWNLPWNVQGADVRDLRRGACVLMDRSAERRFGPFSVGDHREILFSPGFAATVFVGTIVMCLGAAMVSFRRVASIDPALVFRT